VLRLATRCRELGRVMRFAAGELSNRAGRRVVAAAAAAAGAAEGAEDETAGEGQRDGSVHTVRYDASTWAREGE
jgi:hypothetical protein